MSVFEIAFLSLVIASFVVFSVSLFITERRCSSPKKEA